MARSSSVSDLARIIHLNLTRAGVHSLGLRLLTRFLDTIYLASLKTEEGKPPQIRISLVDPENPDPDKPRRIRANRWKITKLASPLPFTVQNLVKLSKAADPWSSSLAVYISARAGFFIWGMVDQTVHFNTMLVRESESGFAPPGLFQIVATGTADLSVYRGYGFVGRLAQDTLLKRQNDVFWAGPIRGCLADGLSKHLERVVRVAQRNGAKVDRIWRSAFAETWISTLCRLLISIQRYSHGGALLITRSKADLDVKYKINYSRLPKALTNLGLARIRAGMAGDQISEEYLEESRDSMPVMLYRHEAIAEYDSEDYEHEITGSVRFVSALSCVDGLILATPDLAVIGFGVEIRTRKEPDVVFLASTPHARENSLHRVNPNDYGTRHRSMMRYCFAHPKSVGFVISQDGEIRVMTRVKARLIMWENLKVLSLWEEDYKKSSATRK